MRQISLREGAPVFRQRVNRTLYMLYKNKHEEFFQMLSDQTPAFWVGFTITLRDVLRMNHHTTIVLRCKINHADRFFIFLHDLLIENKREHIKTYINDVIAMARYNKFINCLEGTIPDCHVIAKDDIDGMTSFERLFGDRKDISSQDKVYHTHVLHLHSLGSLLAAFQLWLTAKKSDKLDWVMPSLWLEEDDLLPFYAHLRKRWGQSLRSMLSIKSHIAWWDCISVVEHSMIIDCSFTELIDAHAALRKLELNDMCRKMLLWNVHSDNKVLKTRPMFVWQVSVCHIYISDHTIIFHPYAQFPSCVYNEAAGPWVWLSDDGRKVLFDDKSPESMGKVQSGIIDILNVHIEVKKAMQLDASFHDSVTSGTTWTSADTMARLLLNMPLCIKWLEWVLVQTYRFEGSFLPFCHFPVRKKIVKVMEKMHATLSHEPRLLAKAAIIVAEKIWLAEKDRKAEDSCRNARALLKFCVERLTPKLKYFIDGSCYKLLKFVLEKGWSKDEQLNGEISGNARKEDFRSVRNGNAADLNIDLSFSSNYRSANYWFNFRDLHNLDFTEQQYAEALTKIAAYQKLIENPPAPDTEKRRGFLKFDKDYYLRFKNAPRESVTRTRDLDAKDLIAISGLAHTAGYLQYSSLIVFNCSVMSKWVPGTAISFPGIDVLQLYNPHAAVMSITSPPIPDKQDMLGMLNIMEWMSVMMDVNGRLCSVLNMFSPHVACPAPKFFNITNTHISIFSKGAADITSLEEANSLLHKLSSQGLIVDQAQTKEPEEIKNPSALVEPVKELESKRLELLEKVAWLQYRNEMGQSRLQHGYPPLADLEYRFVEELAALRKSCEMGQQKSVERLVQLLSHRYNRLVTSYGKWRVGESGLKVVLAGDYRSHEQFFLALCNLKAKIMALLIQLRSIFSAYLSPLLTTHPFSETSECLLLRLLDVLISNTKNNDEPIPSVHLYGALMVKGLSYLEQLLEDCIEVWNIPEFYADPINVPVDVFSHAELIHVALTQLILSMAERLPFCDSYGQARVVLTVYTLLVKAATLIRVGVMNSKVDLLREISGLYRVTCNTLAPFAGILKEFRLTKDGWRGYSKMWALCLKFAKNGMTAPFLKRLQVDEFVGKVHVITMQSENDKTKKAASATVNQQKSTVCSKKKSNGHAVETDTCRNVEDRKGPSATTSSVNSVKQKSAEINARMERAQNSGKGKKHKKRTGGKSSAESHAKCEEADVVESLQNLHLNCCFGCQKMEQNSETFIKCGNCISDKWTIIRVYCSSACKAADWERRHAAEHHVGERESDYADHGLDID